MRIFFKYTVFYSSDFPSEGNHSNNRQCCFKDKCCGSPNSQRARTEFSYPYLRIIINANEKRKKKVWRLQRQQP